MFTQKNLLIGSILVVSIVGIVLYSSQGTETVPEANLDTVSERAKELVDSVEPAPVVTEATTSKTAVVNEEPVTVPETVVPVTPTPVVVTPVPVPTPAPAPVIPPAAPVETGITKAEVATHASEASCWSIVNGGVYDLTSYVPRHPGGKSEILAICGKDGTRLFEGQHGGESKPERILSGFFIDDLAS